jgi:hypothetical protein
MCSENSEFIRTNSPLTDHVEIVLKNIANEEVKRSVVCTFA